MPAANLKQVSAVDSLVKSAPCSSLWFLVDLLELRAFVGVEAIVVRQSRQHRRTDDTWSMVVRVGVRGCD